MTLIDYNWDEPTREASVALEDTRRGYRISEMAQKGWPYHAARIGLAALTLGLFVAAGMIWTMPGAGFPGDPFMSRAALSVVLLIIAAALVANGAFARGTDTLEVDVKGRVLNLIERRVWGSQSARKTVRFEEITRIDLAETSLMSELKSALTRWDYGRITLRMHGKRPMTIVAGDMAELEPLLRRLRGDTGVA